MAGRLREWTFLPPAGHPAVDQARVVRQCDVRAQSQALGDAGAEAFDEHVCPLDEAEDEFDVGGVFEIRFHDAAAAVGLVAGLPGCREQAGALYADHVGAEVGEQRRSVRAGTDAGEFDNADTGERSGAGGGRHEFSLYFGRWNVL